MIELFAAEPLPEEERVLHDPEATAPFAKHGPRFIRAACHIVARTKDKIRGLDYGDVFCAEAYGLSPVNAYAALLGSELRGRGPIDEILACPFPAFFRDLWRGDVGRWYVSLGQPSQSQTTAGEEALRLCP